MASLRYIPKSAGADSGLCLTAALIVSSYSAIELGDS